MSFDDFHNFCIGLPHVTEDFPFGENVLVYRVGGKIFALTDAALFDSINLKCDPELAIELRETYPAVTPGYHMNKKHWNTVVLDGSVPAVKVLEWTKHAYELVLQSLPKKLKTELGL